MHPYHTENEADLPAVKRSNLQISVREMESEIDRQIGMLDDWRSGNLSSDWKFPTGKIPELQDWIKSIWEMWAKLWALMGHEEQSRRCRQSAAQVDIPEKAANKVARKIIADLGREFEGSWADALKEKTRQDAW